MTYSKMALTLVMVAAPKLAFAHIGHIGDLAGHGHLIGLAGLAATGAGAVLWGILRAGDKTADEDSPEDGVEDSPEDGVEDGIDAANQGTGEATPAIS